MDIARACGVSGDRGSCGFAGNVCNNAAHMNRTMTPKMNWDDLRHVLALARGGSVGAAARRRRFSKQRLALQMEEDTIAHAGG
jgi:hypothetical protein